MLPEHIYFTGAGLLGYLLYAPAVVLGVGLLHALLLRHIGVWALRWGTTAVLAVTLLSLPFWDVLTIAYEADKLCKEQGGLHVYKTVEAESFAGSTGIEYWSKYGFKYLEAYGKRITLRDGKPHYESVDIAKYKSRYQYYGAVEDVVGRFERSRYIVDDRRTREKLGELVTFSIYPGWFDRLFLGLLPVEFNPWICGEEPPPGVTKYGEHLYSDDLIRATVKPKK